MKRIALTGGGTGGHIYPLIAVAEHLTECECRYFGPRTPFSEAIEKAGMRISPIASAKMRRYVSLMNAVDGIKFLWSIGQALVKIGIFWPHAAFSKGGPGALPVLIACRLYGVPIIVHESDSVPGLVNRITGKWAKIVELGWEGAAQWFSNKETRVIGVPLRMETMQWAKSDPREAKSALGLDPEKPALFVTGGSQGSARINELIMEILPELLTEYEVIHQIGSATYGKCMERLGTMEKELSDGRRANYRASAFMGRDMGKAYAAADCVISRAGSAIFEIAAYGKPSILIPLPEAANDHQRMNAEKYAATGAAIMLEEKDMTPESLKSAIKKAIENRETMGSAALAFAKPEAAQAIAGDIMRIVGSI